jgi:Lipocalin-like domain
MKRILLIAAYTLFFYERASAQNQQLYGTWRLVSAVTTVLSTGEKYDALGKAPIGYITYGPEGRMQVIIVADQRSKPGHAAIADMTDPERKDLLMTFTAYAGTYNFDGKTVTHHIDLSWNQVWSGTDQIRDVRLDGDRVILTTRPGPSPRDGRMGTVSLVWQKVR